MLNFLDRKIKIVISKSHTYIGQVFYFSEKVIILKNSSNYEVINVENFQNINLEFIEEEQQDFKV